MGQCTSGELPPPISDGVDEHIATENGDYQSQPERDTQKSSSRKLFRRRSSSSSWVSNKFSRGRKAKDLSAAFNMLDYDAKLNLLNINIAAEEELMTLPGVTRTVARNIVEYRTAIGGFRRVEDLALVSGVGAAKLQTFKCDITVKKRSPSVDSLPSCESGRSQRSHSQSHSGRSLRGSPVHAINVNAASIFELMNVRGMNQEMAANIVEYRERKGPFKSIEELVKVRGISARVLSILKVYLTVNNVPPASPPISDVISVASYSRVYQRNLDVKIPGHRRTHSAPLNNDGNSPGRLILDPKDTADPRISVDFSADIFELLSLRSERPIIREVFNGYHHGQPAIRIATWNLQQLTKDKICNPGVLEVVCRTILENGFSLLAIQEVGSKDVLEKICSELNQSSLRRVREWGGPKGEWRWQVSEEPAGHMHQGAEYAAFMYNVSHGLHLSSATLLDVHGNNNSKTCKSSTKKPYLGYFKSYEFDFVVVSLHINAMHLENRNKRNKIKTRSTNDDTAGDEPNKTEETRSITETSQLAPLVTALKEKLISEKNVILFGDFGMHPDDAAFDVLREASYSSIVPADDFTSVAAKNGEGSCCDNIWLNPYTRTVYTGNWGVVRQGLNHLAIPCGWGWGGVVSNHCPIYCDLYSHCNLESEQAGALHPTENLEVLA
ncbi:endonuclease/exonuclease/phosphatase family domain-containing protein 1-like isoform X2 [Panulirus ornatus]|uniref:endonuclease/exonuclease/phosphatase family domain-containing protein 1-like isoform X2 n=1 Tax=Panulirus ornatus TaxID=150431 RepID=UPI003A8C4EF8